MLEISLNPGHMPLANWRAIYRGAPVRLSEACFDKVEASARAVESIIVRGEPVYGINTGFGKLANVRIQTNDLATLQRNIVLSHAAGTGPPMPREIVRLMLALKINSLAQGASGVRLQTLQMLELLLDKDLTPDIPAQGSVGASGDLAPLSHMTAALMGVGHIITRQGRTAATEALAKAGLNPIVLGPKEGLALLNGTQFSTAYALAGLFEAELLMQSALVTGALKQDRIPDLRIYEGHRHGADLERDEQRLAANAIGKLTEHPHAERSAEDGHRNPQRRTCQRKATLRRQIGRQPDHHAVIAEVGSTS